MSQIHYQLIILRLHQMILEHSEKIFIIYNKTITIDDQIRDEKIEYDINREAAKISALSSGKIHKYKYLTGKDILPSDQQQIIEQAKYNYFPLGKAFQNQIKTIENQGGKQVKALNTFKLKKQKKLLTEKNLVYRASRDIYEGKITLEEANEDQKNLLRDIKN